LLNSVYILWALAETSIVIFLVYLLWVMGRLGATQGSATPRDDASGVRRPTVLRQRISMKSLEQ
jgi:hypothetical protein